MPDYLTLAGYLRSNGVTSPAQCELLITTLLIERPTGTNPPPLTPPLTAADYFDLAGYIRDNGVTSPAQCEQLITTLLLQRPTGGVTPPPPFPTGATHYWALNEAGANDVRVDSIGGLDLTPTGSPPSISGPLDLGVSVNGENFARYLASSAAPSFRTTGEWTFNFWTKAIGTLDGENTFRQGISTADADLDSLLWMQQGAGNTSLRLSDGSSHTTINTNPGDALFDGGWHMFSLRKQLLSTSIEWFVDGVLVSSAVNAKGVNAISLAFQIGHATSTSAADAQGMADFGTWPRSLTDQEITDLFNSGTPLRP